MISILICNLLIGILSRELPISNFIKFMEEYCFTFITQGNSKAYDEHFFDCHSGRTGMSDLFLRGRFTSVAKIKIDFRLC